MRKSLSQGPETGDASAVVEIWDPGERHKNSTKKLLSSDSN